MQQDKYDVARQQRRKTRNKTKTMYVTSDVTRCNNTKVT